MKALGLAASSDGARRQSPNRITIDGRSLGALEIRPDRIALVTFDQPGSRANLLSQAVQSDLEGIHAQLRERRDLRGLRAIPRD